MRHAAALLLSIALATPAVAQTRTITQINGWRAFDVTAAGGGVASCGLETRDPDTGRHFLLQQAAGEGRPVLRLSRSNWNLGASTTRPVRIAIDNRRTFSATATASGREISWPVALDEFEPAFRRGTVMRVEFPSRQDTTWVLSLRGTSAVMGAFMGCLRMLVIQPGEAPISPPPALEPLRRPAEPPPADLPRGDLPPDKPVRTEKPQPSVKPGPGSSPTPL